jgi:valyl-tRNA synthetase
MPTILDDAAAVANTGTAYDGLDRYEARRRIVADLAARGDLAGERPHEMVVGRCQRSNDVLEPRLKTQWFIRTQPLAAAALEATRSGRTRIVPALYEKTWEHWLTTIRDWNVSRQLWWGHRIPAWYCPDGHVTVSAEEDGPSACDVCARPVSELSQDPDIFDTWFSSGLWPFSTLGWPDDTADYRRYYPTTVMETGYDIIFFWVARMVMLGIELTGRTPFEVVTLSGLIRDPIGRKMSKTTGNVIDPLGVIDDTGADALRFALIHGATPGIDQKFGEQKLENARNFANKLWNATRFVLGARPAEMAADAPRQEPDPARLGPIDRWILSRAAATTDEVNRGLTEFQFAEVTRALYDGIWSEFCDWGVELAKVRLSDETLGPEDRAATWWTLVAVLDRYLRLLHPVMPFVTEVLWGRLPHAATEPELWMVARWPVPAARDATAEAQLGAFVELVRAIRNARAEARIEPGRMLPVELTVPDDLGEAFEAVRPAIARLARARPLERHPDRAALEAATKDGGGLAVIAGGIEAVILQRAEDDRGEGTTADRLRLERELTEAEGHLASARARLANEAFTAKAPRAVVEGARAREAELADQVERLRTRLGR